MKNSFDTNPIEKRKEIANGMSAEQLLTAFLVYDRNFDPIDSDFCDSYEILKNEIIERCKK